MRCGCVAFHLIGKCRGVRYDKLKLTISFTPDFYPDLGHNRFILRKWYLFLIRAIMGVFTGIELREIFFDAIFSDSRTNVWFREEMKRYQRMSTCSFPSTIRMVFLRMCGSMKSGRLYFAPIFHLKTNLGSESR